MEDQFSGLMELLRHQDNINAFNTVAPNHSCGNRECEAECGKVVKIAKNLGVDPVPMVQNAIENTLASKFGCRRKTEAFSNIGKPIPGCKFGYTYGSHPDATDAQLAAGKTGGKSHAITDTQIPDASKGTHVVSANIKGTQLGKEAPPATKKVAPAKNSEDSFNEEGERLYKGTYKRNDKGASLKFEDEFKKDYSAKNASLYDAVNADKDNYEKAVKAHVKYREGDVPTPYLDSEGNPTIGVGVNMRNEDNRKILEDVIGRKLTPEENAALSKKCNTKAGKDALAEATKNIKLTPEQSQKLFDTVYPVHENEAKKQINKGAWCEKTEKVNDEEKKTRYYDETKDDPNAWDKLDPVAKGACIDMEYNGALKKYPKFLEAIKNKDYKRAAYELLNSKDFKKEDKGVQDRRRDMAKDLMKLHEEKSKSQK